MKTGVLYVDSVTGQCLAGATENHTVTSVFVRPRKLTPAERSTVYNKYNGRCAYCGLPLGELWHVDHKIPVFRGWSEADLAKYKCLRGKDDLSNMMPACTRCNQRKSALTLSEFRNEIAASVTRAMRDSAACRLAVDFHLIHLSKSPAVRFYFERLDDDLDADRVAHGQF